MDECETGVCEDECLNTPGSFRCFCDGHRGLKLREDLRSCKVRTGVSSKSLIIQNNLSVSVCPADHNALHVPAPEEEPPFSLSGPHVQRRAGGAAAFPPQGPHGVRKTLPSSSSCRFLQFVSFKRSSLQLFSGVRLPHLRPRGSYLLRRGSPEQLLDRPGNASWEAGAAAEVRLSEQSDQQRAGGQRRPVEEGPFRLSSLNEQS